VTHTYKFDKPLSVGKDDELVFEQRAGGRMIAQIVRDGVVIDETIGRSDDIAVVKGTLSLEGLGITTERDVSFLSDAERLLASIYHFHQDVSCRCIPATSQFDTHSGQLCCENFGCPQKFATMRSRIAEYFGDGNVSLGCARLSTLREIEDRDWELEVDGGHRDQIRAICQTGVLADRKWGR